MTASARLIGAAFLIAVSLAGSARADLPDLARDWRPHDAIKGEPVLETVDCDGTDLKCAERHGVYRRDVYLRIAVDPDDSLFMLSDSTLDAKLAPHKGAKGKWNVKWDGGSAQLHLGGSNCHGLGMCMEITKSSDEDVLRNTVYVPVSRNMADAQADKPLSDTFKNVPPNFDMATRCFDITKLNLDDFEDDSDCAAGSVSPPIFLTLDDIKDTKNYSIVAPEGHNVSVPFGWRYKVRQAGWGQDASRVLQSERDVVEAHSDSMGWKTGLDLFVVNFSVSHNQTTQNMVEHMTSNSLTYAQFQFLETSYALIMDKANATFQPDFVRAVTKLIDAEAPDYGGFIDTYGTHYAYATTYGNRGSRLSTLTEDAVLSLHDQGISVTTGGSAGISIPTEYGTVGASGGGDSGSSDDEKKKMSETLQSGFGTSFCSGGVTCDGTHASGNAWAPVLLDLRPLSDLLGPPFFQDSDARAVAAAKAGLAAAIKDHAFSAESASDTPTTRFLRIAGVSNDGCWLVDAGTGDRDGRMIANDVPCAMSDITIKGPSGGFMTLPGTTQASTTTKAGPGALVFRSATDGSPPSLDIAATVARPASACTAEGAKAYDGTQVSGVATGSLQLDMSSLPSPGSPVTQWTRIFDPQCDASNPSIEGPAKFGVVLEAVTAADILITAR